MWDNQKQTRLGILQREEELGTLRADQERELATLYAELDAEEVERLRPAMDQMDRDIEVLRDRNSQLAAIAAKRRRLLVRMRSHIGEWLREDEKLRAEADPLVGAGGSH